MTLAPCFYAMPHLVGFVIDQYIVNDFTRHRPGGGGGGLEQKVGVLVVSLRDVNFSLRVLRKNYQYF